ASKRTKGEVNQPVCAQRNCSQGKAAGWPWRRLYTSNIVSSPRSSATLEEEVIPADLQSASVGVRRCRPDGESGGKNVLPGSRRAGANQDAVIRPVQDGQFVQPEGLRPLGGQLDAVAGFYGGDVDGAHNAATAFKPWRRRNQWKTQRSSRSTRRC